MMRKEMTAKQALMRLEDLCARGEQCSNDLRHKLAGWGISSDVSDKILARLKRDRYVDDSRFARAYCRDKFCFSRWGRIKIKNGLVLKRIPREYIAEALDEIDEDEYLGTLVALLRSKARTIDAARSYEDKMRLLRFAVSRGFETSLAAKVINGGEIWQED